MSNSRLGDALPSYKKPPVNEVVFGMQFNTPENFYIPHIGILWDKFRSDYPVLNHAPTITSSKGQIKIDAATGVPIPRVWFINNSDDELVQFQVDRFYFNWRHRKSDYPRYEFLKEKFVTVLTNVNSFFNEFNFGNIDPTEFELTYINHIPKGEGWDSFDELPNIFSDFNWTFKEERFLPNPQKISWSTEFLLPSDMGRLLVTLKLAVRADDKNPLLVLELKSLGSIETNSKEEIIDWFNISREWIVRGFTDITTPSIQKIWEIE